MRYFHLLPFILVCLVSGEEDEDAVRFYTRASRRPVTFRTFQTAPGPCQHGGIYRPKYDRCDCLVPYTGLHCENVVPGLESPIVEQAEDCELFGESCVAIGLVLAVIAAAVSLICIFKAWKKNRKEEKEAMLQAMALVGV